MSILIEGMDKPTDCGLCPFEDFGYCNVKGERNTSENGIDADCPLIEVADRKTEPIRVGVWHTFDDYSVEMEGEGKPQRFRIIRKPFETEQTERSE